MYQSSNSDDNLIKNNNLNTEINRLREFQNTLKEDDSQMKEIIRNNSSFNNENFSVSLNDLKAILFEIASFYQVNLETFLESFLVKFRDKDLISYLDFMNYFIENLEKQERILAAINLNNNNNNALENNYNNANYFNGDVTENYNENLSLDNNTNYKAVNSSSIDPANTTKKDDLDYQENKINSINLNNINETDNLFLMILHRSLYILKKKFELYKKEINSIYEEHSEKNKFNRIVNTDNFISVLDKIFITCKINFLDINQPSDLFKAEIIENYSEEKLNMIEKQIKSFMLNGRKYYNDRFKYKREKEFYEIFLKEKEAVTNSLKLATENNINTSNNKTNTNPASVNARPKNPINSQPGVKKISNNKMNESTNNANNVSLNESRISKVNEPKKRESNANSSLKNLKSNNAGNTSSKNLNISPRKESEAVKSKSKNDSVGAKNNAKKQLSKQTSAKSLVGNKKQEEDNEDNVNDVDLNANNNVDVISNANLLEENLDLNPNHTSENIQSENNYFNNDLNAQENNKEALADAGKNSKNDLFVIESLEHFRAKKLDDEIKTIILDDVNNSELGLKLNRNVNQDNSVKYLIVDAIPLIIADFIHENINIAILDMSEDLKSDLRGLFDKEIIKKIEEASQYDTENERVLKLKEYLFEKLNTQKNIKTYEDLFLTKKTQRENTSHILNILEKLRNHLSLIDKKIQKLQNGESNNSNNYSANEKGQTVIENVLNLNNNYNTNALDYTDVGYNKGNKVFVSKVIPKKSKTKEEIRMENFRQIFDFYAKQHQFISKNSTFEEIQEKFNVMVLAEYIKFAIEFKIPLKKELVTEIFKKHAKNAKDMHFEEFMQSLDKMSAKINEEKIKSNLAKIKKLRAILAGKDTSEAEKIQKQKYNLNKKPEQEPVSNLQEEGENNQESKENNEEQANAQNENNDPSSLSNNNYNDNFVLENNSSVNLNLNNNENEPNAEEQDQSNAPNQTQNPTELEIKKTQKQVFELKKKTAAELLNDLYELLKIDDPKTYQSKMKGFALPFSNDKFNIRLPEGSPAKRIFKADPISQENLKRILKERKEQKLKEVEEKEKLEKLNILENKKKAKLVNEKIKNNITNKHDKLYVTKDKIPNKYSDIKKKQENIIKEKESKLTWDQLENLNFNHFITNREDDFNPNDLFDDIYDSDDENIFDDIQHIEKNTLNNKTKKSKDTASSYLNIHTNLNIANNNTNVNSKSINLNSSENDTIPDSILKNYSGKSRGSPNAQYSGLNIANIIAQGAIKNLNSIKQIGDHSPVGNNRHNSSLHSSNDGNHSNLSIFDNESSHKVLNKKSNNNAINDSYEMHRKSAGNKSPKGVGKGAGYGQAGIKQKQSGNSDASVNLKNMIVRNKSPRKVLNRSIEKSAGSPGNKNKRSSSKSNIHINQNQRYAALQSPKSVKGLNNEKVNKQIYSIEKTEKMARELEKNREDQKSRLMKKHDDLVKKSIDKIKKYL